MHSVAKLEEISELHLHDFGIFIELMPDDEEKQLLENNLQMAIQQGSIDLEDAIDVREIKSVKLGNQVLKIRRKKKLERDQRMQQENIQAQAKANADQQQAAAQSEVQKQQALTQSQIQLEQAKAEMKNQTMVQETELKKQLMKLEFDFNMQLKQAEVTNAQDKDKGKEDRKDERTKIQATQQSEMIDQRNNGKPPKNFESSGNDILGGGMGDMSSFGPR
jgi:hypothetical protein